ncbi:MAG: thioredoxin family protein [Bacilli bacterium]|nr:thioredoxin family protein [Bacilli bacterium]MDD4733507.1 thioredoxin family protein [Bacilli bacterium]
MRIVKIGAIWCPGCLFMKKTWDEVVKQYPDLEIVSYDIDMDDVSEYGVKETLPVIIFYNGDKEYKRLIGEKKIEEIVNIIEEIKEL